VIPTTIISSSELFVNSRFVLLFLVLLIVIRFIVHPSFSYLVFLSDGFFFVSLDLILSLVLVSVLRFLLFSFVLSFCVHSSSHHQIFLVALVGRSSVLLLRN
jgi:hypothetical protein